MSMSKTCPRCGAKTKERSDRNGYVSYKCGSSELDGVFDEAEACKPKSLAHQRAAEHGARQRRVMDISEAILKHAAELEELAEELCAMGCDCNHKPCRWDQHDESCPMFLARQAHRKRENSSLGCGGV